MYTLRSNTLFNNKEDPIKGHFIAQIFHYTQNSHQLPVMTENQGHYFTTEQHPAWFSVCFLHSCVSVCFTVSVCFGRGLKLQLFDPVTQALGSKVQLYVFCVQPRGTFFPPTRAGTNCLQNQGCSTCTGKPSLPPLLCSCLPDQAPNM